MVRAEHEIYQYLRHKKKFPGVWCAGCGIGIVLAAIIRAVDRLGLNRDDVAMVSGHRLQWPHVGVCGFQHHAHHARPRAGLCHRPQARSAESARAGGHGRRRRPGHRRQPLYAYGAPQYRPHGDRDQQQHLWHDRRAVFAVHT